MATRNHTYYPRKRKPLADRFWPKVAVKTADECWEWSANKYPNGYGQIAASAHKKLLAHRVAWELHFGVIPPGMSVCHKCDNPPCCNPNHLFLGTTADNLADMQRKGRKVLGLTIGIANGNSKLTEADVREIRRLSAAGIGGRKLAKMFGLKSKSSVRSIVKRLQWGHVTTLANHQPQSSSENPRIPNET